jgi:hypothetical protein
LIWRDSRRASAIAASTGTAFAKSWRAMTPISVDAVPVLLAPDARPLSAIERALVQRMDGLCTVGEIARDANVAVSKVRELLHELVAVQAVAFEHITITDERELLEAIAVDEPWPTSSEREENADLAEAILTLLAPEC